MQKILFLLMLVASMIACQQESQTTKQDGAPNETTEKFDQFFSELHQKGAFNGNVLVADKGNVVFEKSYGLANEETKTPLNTESVFELASVSKQFTAMGIVQLKKEGKLSFDDPMSKYIPELKAYDDITIKNLLIHTGGLPDYMALADQHWDRTKIATNDDMINLFAKLTPKRKFQPNEKWAYSNTGYLLLGTIIERVSGKSFGEYLKEKIFEPLEMDNTLVYRRRFKPQEVENYAEGYIYSDSLKRKILPDELGKASYFVFLDGVVGDGMVNSNLHDLLKWDRALYSNQLVDEDDREMIFASYQTSDGEDTDYGFGWMIKQSKKYGKIVAHSGGWAGYRTYIARDIEHDKTIIMLQNNSLRKTEMPVKNTRRMLYNQAVEKPIKLANKTLKSYAGKYLDKEKEKEIIFEDGKLYVPMNPETKIELIPVSQTKFIVDGFSPEVAYTFILNGQGEVEKYRVQQEETGLDKEATRMK